MGYRMKRKLESDLNFRLHVLDVVYNLFYGQEVCRTGSTGMSHHAEPQTRLAFLKKELGVEIRLALSDDGILANLNDIQIRDGLSLSKSWGFDDFVGDGGNQSW